ncbi:MAG: T9SS type A sorting domain-containing protein [Flavobacterium sp.]|nr:T9SS type A sorting domain-containing protein [Flavobacterium sp.]
MRNLYLIASIVCMMFSGLQAQNITRIEYFINTDPGFGLGTALTGYTPSANVANLSANINLSLFTNGINTLYIRAKDANGQWSITNHFTFVKDPLIAPVIAANTIALEYFIDTDPGFALATAVPITPAQNISNFTFPANIATVTTGNHNLFIRAKDANGKWSLTNVLNFEKTALGVQVSEMEKLFTVYPNPSNSVFNLSYPVNKNVEEVSMIDLLGKTIVVPVSNFENGKQINANQLTSGTYFIKITTQEGVFYKKVIKN